MVTQETELFIRLPEESSDRVLHPVEVVSVSDELVTIRPTDPALVIEPGTELLVYFELKREFMQQSASVRAIMSEAEECPDDAPASEGTEETTLLGLELTGKPVSAESRQTYRVSTVLSNRTIRVKDVENCQLCDVSVDGFSVMCGQELRFAELVSVSIGHGDRAFEGSATVQSIKDMGSGRHRYGFHLVEERASTLTTGLQRMSADVQREQLRRQARG